MWAQGIVLVSPVIDEQTGFLQRVEPVLIETVVTEGAVEGLNEGVLCGFTGLDVIEMHLAPLGPEVKGFPCELRPVVTGDGTGSS